MSQEQCIGQEAEEESETFCPRGLGSNWLRCFICGSTPDGDLNADGVHYSGLCQPDMAAFVHCRAAGVVVRQMFSAAGMYAFLDYRPSEPQWVQVKVGACLDHLPKLCRLEELVGEAGNRISREILSAVQDDGPVHSPEEKEG